MRWISAAQEATDSSPWWVAPAVVAACIAAVVALVSLAIQARRGRIDRQRQVFAEAYADVAAYCEFPYIIRRRIGTNDDDVRITSAFSEVQHRLNRHRALVRVESPRVSRSFDALLEATREVAGAAAREGWSLPIQDLADDKSVSDVDLRDLKEPTEEYLDTVADHLSVVPAFIRRFGRWIASHVGSR